MQPRDMNGGVGGSGGGGSSGSGTGELTERARGAVYAGPPRRTIGNDDAIFDHENPKIKEVLKTLTLILQPPDESRFWFFFFFF